MIYLFVLVAIAKADTQVAVPAYQTISYHATAAECQHAKNAQEYNRDYITLDCVPIRWKE